MLKNICALAIAGAVGAAAAPAAAAVMVLTADGVTTGPDAVAVSTRWTYDTALTAPTLVNFDYWRTETGSVQSVEYTLGGVNYVFTPTSSTLFDDMYHYTSRVDAAAPGFAASIALGGVFGYGAAHAVTCPTSPTGCGIAGSLTVNGVATGLRFAAYTIAPQALAEQATAPVVAAHAPEPGAWALMITGFGMVGAALRRKRMAPA